MKHCIVILALISAVVWTGCSEETRLTPVAGEQNELSLSKTISRDGPISLSGRDFVSAYYAKSGELFIDPAVNFCETNAILHFLDGNNIILEIIDSPCWPGQTVNLEGTLTPGGELKLYWPEFAIATLEGATGCTLSGTWGVLHGSFDGETLQASTHNHGPCSGGTFWGPVFGVSFEKGPVHLTSSIDLTVEE